MQISVAKVIKSLINLVYAVNLITIKVGWNWGRFQDQRVPPLFQVWDLAFRREVP